MWWSDSGEVKEAIALLDERLLLMDNDIQDIKQVLENTVEDLEREKSIILAQKTLDKFDDYMKNVDKLNAMINEFKGCVSLARGAIEERKELDKQTDESKKLANISQKIYESMLNFIKASENIKHEAHYKIDAIYRTLCENEEEKPTRKRKPAKKKAT